MLILILPAVCAVLILCAGSAFAENNVYEIDIEAVIRNDGSAHIIQHWRGSFDEGTENYIPISTRDISVSKLRVSDKAREYAYLADWDINAGFEEKTAKCGINETDDGVELCFGISEYGENSYTVEYDVEAFIKGYTDCDGTNFMFINPNMSTFPTDGRVTIRTENGIGLNEENSAIWAFGYDGSVEFQNGTVVAETSSALTGDASMIVMLSLSKGLIFPNTETGVSFETVKDAAFEGSDYGYEDVGILETIIGFVILLAIPALIVTVVVLMLKRKKAIKKFYGDVGYFRDVPNNGRIEVSHYLAQSFDVADEESYIMGALILSMINKGVIEPQIERSVGFFGKQKEEVSLKLVKEPDTQAERRMYELLTLSAGEDGILQEMEIESYSYAHPEKINEFIDGIKKMGENELVALGGFSGGAGNHIKDLSERGKSELAEVMGLKKYLEDFTLIAERKITETIIWKDYMVYAALFGIAERVMKQLERIYPDKLPEIKVYNRNVIIASGYCRSMYMSSQRAIQERRTSGGGGGGGFSGGGRGGGSR